MSCDCKKLKGYDLALRNAKQYEKRTGRKAAFFRVENDFSFTELSNVKKVKGICCYFTTDEKEHEIKVKTTKSTSKKKEVDAVQELQGATDS